MLGEGLLPMFALVGGGRACFHTEKESTWMAAQGPQPEGPQLSRPHHGALQVHASHTRVIALVVPVAKDSPAGKGASQVAFLEM